MDRPTLIKQLRREGLRRAFDRRAHFSNSSTEVLIPRDSDTMADVTCSDFSICCGGKCTTGLYDGSFGGCIHYFNRRKGGFFPHNYGRIVSRRNLSPDAQIGG